MYKLYLKIALRYLLKNKLYSFINIFGLAIGIASFVLIMLYVNYENSYDKFEGSENVYRTYIDYREGNGFVPGDAQTYNLSGPSLKKEFPEVLDYVRFFYFEKLTFKLGERILEEPLGSLVDPSYFNIFGYPLLKGDKESVLSEPYTIVLSKSFAEKLFGTDNPLQKTISAFRDGQEALLTVTGVMEDLPETAHYRNSFLISYETEKTWTDWGPRAHELNWNANNYYTYLKLDPNADPDLLRQKIIDSDIEEDTEERHNIEPIEAIHLHSNKPYEVSVNGSATRIKFLTAIAFVILILSWLNYVNLAATKSMERAKETGIRKVVGAQKPQLILQSLIESILLNGLAISITILVILVLLPIYNSITGKELSLSLLNLSDFAPYFAFILLGMIIAGLYPALLLSSYSPAKVLKGEIRTSSGGLTVRKGLIVTQFLATIILLTGTIVVTKQINFLEKQPIGTNLNQVIALQGEVLANKVDDSLVINDFKILEEELKKLTFVEKVAFAQTYPGDSFDNLSSTRGIELPDGRNEGDKLFYTYHVQPDYFDLMDIEFVGGSTFLSSSDFEGDQIIVNETFLKIMGFSSPDEIVNKTVSFWGSSWEVSGVIKDYYHFGLKRPLLPIVIRYQKDVNNVLIKLDKSAISTTGFGSAIGRIKSKWNKIFPKSTFNYTFLDQKFEAQYKDDKAFGKAFQIFTILAILIASMGLFGLTSYICIQRKKEIGIRKVNGATIGQILTLLNKDFVKWIGLAFVLAVPISWYFMNQWLQGFANKTEMSWWIFALAGISALAIALLTVSWQSFQAAAINPVESLKDE